MIIKGSFDVKMTSATEIDTVDGVALARMTLSKVFQGPLEGTSTVEMMSARGPIKDSAGYVALERVKATVEGRAGTFVCQHSGTMNRGQQSLVLTVVPDSGTGELKTIAGSMKIDIVEGKHFYTFDYSL